LIDVVSDFEGEFEVLVWGVVKWEDDEVELISGNIRFTSSLSF
jgi:hypothetical protein